MVCALLFCLMAEGVTENRKDGKVVYRYHGNVEEVLLDSLKAAMPLFKGMATLKRETAGLRENMPVAAEPLRAGRKRLDGTEIAERRRESVLLMSKYLRQTTRPEEVSTWASAVVVTADGVCVTNYHVLRELIDTAATLNVRDSLLFASSESGRVYPIRRVLSYNRAADLAFFEIDTRGDELEPMPLGGDLPAGAEVWTLTNPCGYPWSVTSGVVSRAESSDPADPFARRLEITADFAKGSSGGPILDGRGNMVAMVSCIRSVYYQDYPPRDLQLNVKVTVPASVIRMLLEEEDEK